VRAVLDANIIISALLSTGGAPASVLRAWTDGAYDLIASPLLLDELERAVGYGKIRERITESEARALLALLRLEAHMHDDTSDPPPVHSPDPGDDYLISLAVTAQAFLVTGDGHLLGFGDAIPVYRPTDFLALLDQGSEK
jgi:uncharacterized protein